jgi:hypothetical protein
MADKCHNKIVIHTSVAASRIYRGSGYRSCQLSCIVCRECNSACRRNRKLIFIAFHCVYSVILGARITIRTTIEPKVRSRATPTEDLTNAQDRHINAAQAGTFFHEITSEKSHRASVPIVQIYRRTDFVREYAVA